MQNLPEPSAAALKRLSATLGSTLLSVDELVDVALAARVSSTGRLSSLSRTCDVVGVRVALSVHALTTRTGGLPVLLDARGTKVPPA